MGLFFDIILAIPIGILYNLLAHKICDITNNDLSYNDKIQKNLIIIFGGSILALIIAYFNKKNKSLKYGLYIGAFLLFTHSVLYNWIHMYNDTKIIIMATCFLALIWYTYKNTKTKYVSSDEYEEDSDIYLPALYIQKEHYHNSNKNYNQDNYEDYEDYEDKHEIINY
jgi:hypothetical protein